MWCVPLCRLEMAIQKRRYRNLPMLYYSAPNGSSTLRSDVELITRLTFRLTHLRQIAWLCPSLIALDWAKASDETQWDLEVQQRPNSTTGIGGVAAMRQRESFTEEGFSGSLLRCLLVCPLNIERRGFCSHMCVCLWF